VTLVMFTEKTIFLSVVWWETCCKTDTQATRVTRLWRLQRHLPTSCVSCANSAGGFGPFTEKYRTRSVHSYLDDRFTCVRWSKRPVVGLVREWVVEVQVIFTPDQSPVSPQYLSLPQTEIGNGCTLVSERLPTCSKVFSVAYKRAAQKAAQSTSIPNFRVYEPVTLPNWTEDNTVCSSESVTLLCYGC
jgi:hypothetical protein